jgi:hypothetical protein
MISPEYKKRLRNQANRNVCHILDQLNITYTEYSVIQAKCPCKQHGGDNDNDSAFSWRQDIGRWVCWTHHCQEQRGNDIFGLVSSVLDCTFGQAVSWIDRALKEKSVSVDDKVNDDISPERNTSLFIHEPVSEHHLRFLVSDPRYPARS